MDIWLFLEAWMFVKDTKAWNDHMVVPDVYLTVIPQARMGSESIAHEAEWSIDSEPMRARGIIVLVKSN